MQWRIDSVSAVAPLTATPTVGGQSAAMLMLARPLWRPYCLRLSQHGPADGRRCAHTPGIRLTSTGRRPLALRGVRACPAPTAALPQHNSHAYSTENAWRRQTEPMPSGMAVWADHGGGYGAPSMCEFTPPPHRLGRDHQASASTTRRLGGPGIRAPSCPEAT